MDTPKSKSKSNSRKGTRSKQTLSQNRKRVLEEMLKKRRETKKVYHENVSKNLRKRACNTSFKDKGDYETLKRILKDKLAEMGSLDDTNYKSKLIETCGLTSESEETQKSVLKNALNEINRSIKSDKFALQFKGKSSVDNKGFDKMEENINHMEEVVKYIEKFLESSDQSGGTWSVKYKNSINCKKPRGFSQRQHCKYGRK